MIVGMASQVCSYLVKEFADLLAEFVGVNYYLKIFEAMTILSGDKNSQYLASHSKAFILSKTE